MVLIKDLFIIAAASQEDISVDVIKKRIEELVREEVSTEPLSDQKIVGLLQGRLSENYSEDKLHPKLCIVNRIKVGVKCNEVA